MSSDYVTAIRAFDMIRMQGLQQSAPTRATAGDVDDVKRKESATGGQSLPPEQADPKADNEQVESAVRKISDFVQNFQRDLQFSVDKASGKTVINVVDSETKQVIRQIPSEESLRISSQMNSPESLIFSEQA
jgi:flagellar protein FlaG